MKADQEHRRLPGFVSGHAPQERRPHGASILVPGGGATIPLFIAQLTRLPGTLHAAHAEVPWSRIVAFRNILIRAYFGVDWEVVWIAATKEAPALPKQVTEILKTEFGEPT